MQLSQIIGQQKVKSKLLQTVKENRISHALLFLGEHGFGGLPLALAFGQYINCADPGMDDSCGICPSCHKYRKLIHPDLHFVFPIVQSDKPKKEVCDDYLPEWREFILQNQYFEPGQWFDFITGGNKQPMIYKNEAEAIIRKLSLKSYESEYKMMIIWMPEKMNTQSANKLLKILEEPPDKTLFILISDQTTDILPTVLSRTQIIKIPKIDDQSMAALLTEKFNLNRLALHDVIVQANGSYTRALEAMQSTEQMQFNFAGFTRMMRESYKLDADGMITFIEEIAKTNRETQKNFLQYSQRLLRESLIHNLELGKISFLTTDEMEFTKKFAPYITSANIENLNYEFEKAIYHIERNGFSKLVFLDLMNKLGLTFKAMKK